MTLNFEQRVYGKINKIKQILSILQESFSLQSYKV